MTKRIDIIGQNGNTGEHYKNQTDFEDVCIPNKITPKQKDKTENDMEEEREIC